MRHRGGVRDGLKPTCGGSTSSDTLLPHGVVFHHGKRPRVVFVVPGERGQLPADPTAQHPCEQILTNLAGTGGTSGAQPLHGDKVLFAHQRGVGTLPGHDPPVGRVALDWDEGDGLPNDATLAVVLTTLATHAHGVPARRQWARELAETAHRTASAIGTPSTTDRRLASIGQSNADKARALATVTGYPGWADDAPLAVLRRAAPVPRLKQIGVLLGADGGDPVPRQAPRRGARSDRAQRAGRRLVVDGLSGCPTPAGAQRLRPECPLRTFGAQRAGAARCRSRRVRRPGRRTARRR
ncbi:hypothetical protein B0I31_10261 [Saccharothrix carnea]|uniref:Uncharacterized protein n=1 Tax=Saccharothrix carnea TaxID=1280637 RepID=A0A2P8IF53_SACCR|nr:hypothetical protein B0I31_10261 [Saccharothrix carnea]